MSISTTETRLEERQRRQNQRQGCFAGARHYIGRLAGHIQARKQALGDASSLAHIPDTFNTVHMKRLLGVPRSEPNSHTTVRGIINRMLKGDDPERSEIEEILICVDEHCPIFSKFMQQFAKSTLTVHAEIQVLEYNFSNKLAFVMNDGYIACSKAAGLCYRLYFQYHPARVVLPVAHEKVWPSWSHPLVTPFQKKDPR